MGLTLMGTRTKLLINCMTGGLPSSSHRSRRAFCSIQGVDDLVPLYKRGQAIGEQTLGLDHP
jgi:hypothetical protein